MSKKIAVAILALLCALPLVWQWNQTGSLREQRDHRRSTAAPGDRAGGVPLSSGVAEDSELRALRNQHAVFSRELEELRESRGKTNKALATLEARKKRLEEEVVVLFGKIEDLAREISYMFRLGDMTSSEQIDEAAKAAAAREVMELMGELKPAFAQIVRLEEDPSRSARFHATMIASLGGLEEAAAATIEARLRPRFEQMKADGLLYLRRPVENREAWDQRYQTAVSEAMRTVEPLLDEEAKKSDWWVVYFQQGGYSGIFATLSGGHLTAPVDTQSAP